MDNQELKHLSSPTKVEKGYGPFILASLIFPVQQVEVTETRERISISFTESSFEEVDILAPRTVNERKEALVVELKLRGRNDGCRYFTFGSNLWGPADSNFRFFKLCCCFSVQRRQAKSSGVTASDFKLASTNNTRKIHGHYHGNKEVSARKSCKFSQMHIESS
jgi:hypothetical protein